MTKINTYLLFILFLGVLFIFKKNLQTQTAEEKERLSYEKFLIEHEYNNRPRMSKKELKKKICKKG